MATNDTLRRMHMNARRTARALSVLLCLGFPMPLSAQQATAPITFRYFYDDAGQLQKVVDSTGVVIEYVYDAVGNIVEIRRSNAADTLAVFGFTPTQGGPLTTVTIRGQGFSNAVGSNVVAFNGSVAAVVSATADSLIAVVPVGATSGPISVTVNTASASSPANFVVLQAPVITSVTPGVIDVARPPSVVQINGLNLSGSVFSVLPMLQPAAIDFGTPTINPAGKTATIPVIVVSNARGRFTVAATSAFGRSDPFPSKNNALWIIAAEDAADTDGDGYPDVLEVQLGSDPSDAESIPTGGGVGSVDALPFSVLQTVGIPTTPTNMEADATSFSTLNLAGMSGGQPMPFVVAGVPLSVLNVNPMAPRRTPDDGVPGDGPAISVGPLESDGTPFSTLNLAGMSAGQPIRVEVIGLPLSVFNTDANAPLRTPDDGVNGGGPAMPNDRRETDGVVFSVNNLAIDAPPGARQPQPLPIDQVHNGYAKGPENGSSVHRSAAAVSRDVLNLWQQLVLNLSRRMP